MSEFKSDPQHPETGRTTLPRRRRITYTFRCSECGVQSLQLGHPGVQSGRGAAQNAEQHGRDQHNLANIDDATRNKVRSQIRRAA